MMIRLFDIIFSLFGFILSVPLLAVLILIGFFDTGSPIFRQVRVGRFKQPFTLIKLRTMKPETVSMATHLASAQAVTPYGSFLRKTKLDELPQLWNVLKGDMSLVGPRPCLYNQEDLIAERDRRGVYDARPGITGLAQVSKIDMSTPKKLAETDAIMLKGFGSRCYFSYIVQTLLGKGAGDRIKK